MNGSVFRLLRASFESDALIVGTAETGREISLLRASLEAPATKPRDEFDLLLLNTGFEAEVDGKAKTEREIEIYGRLQDISQLEQAPEREIQEQWGVFIPKKDDNAASGSIRVRMIQRNGGAAEYVYTSKITKADGREEVEIPATEAMFHHYRLLADQGLRKCRYFFPIEGTQLTYEIDAFFGPNGGLQPWVKIDLELPDGVDLEELPPFPVKLEEVRVIAPGTKNDADKAFVERLFNEYFRTPNLYLQ